VSVRPAPGRKYVLGLDLLEPELAGIARWVGAGLTAFDAAYVAVAEPLVAAG
jgi:hypothetical protein